MKNLNVCLCPMKISWEDKEHNLETLAQIAGRVHPDTDLLILPETFSTGFPSGDKEHIRPMAERLSGNTVMTLRKLATKYNMAIAGSFIADVGGSLCNRAFFIEPGDEETYADKRHLFTMAGEDKSFSRGYDRLRVRFRGWNISMIVCYDVRFPVWCRNKGNEYDLLIAVANWPIARVDAWNKLLIARAIENEAYVCGVNCQGTDLNGFQYNGSSMAIDFKGKEMISYAAEMEGADNIEEAPLLYTSLSLEKLERFREKFPAWRDADRFEINETF